MMNRPMRPVRFFANMRIKTLEDWDLLLRLAEIGELANLPEILLKYRQHFSSVTHLKSMEQAKLREIIYGQAYARRGIALPPAPANGKREPRRRHEQHRYW